MIKFTKLFILTIGIFLIPIQSFSAVFHVLVNNQQQGPVSMEQLQQMTNDGIVTKDTMVWENGMPDWGKAGEQQDLQGLFAASAPPPPTLPTAGIPPAPPSPPPSSPVGNNQSITTEEKQDMSVHNFPLVSDISGTNLEQQRDKWLKGDSKKPRRKLGFDKKGSYIGWGAAAIESDPQQLDFGQKRIMAFEKAFSDAKGKFVRAKKQEVAVSLTRKFFNVDLPKDGTKIKDGRIVGLGKKIAALTEATIDKALKEMGIDPKDIESSTILSKRRLAENSLSKKITVKATQRVSGIRILATFEDLKGVGVLIKQNRNYSNLASAIASGKLVGYPSKTDPVDDIANQLDQKFSDQNNLIPQYGVRIMTDHVGNRVLVSFGQWSPKITKSDSRMKMNMAFKAAKEIAYDQALSYMTQFVNTTIALENETELKGSDAITRLEHTNNTTEDVENSDVGAWVDQFIKENSTWSCEGCTETMTWAVNHPETGHPIVGKVLMWSPLTQEYARQKPRPDEKLSTKRQKTREIKSKIRTSVDIGDEDF